ncbi:MAG: sigma-70 family RNA polymerase sigma factor [Pirellulaceae bacterium]|nr:sigma-70 family RNA polymerase sigma factor [Pirellulaceae bacterium]
MTFQAPAGPSELPAEPALVAAAVGGDRIALERLLLAQYDLLAGRIGAKLPTRLQATQAVEDILQLTFLQAFSDIGQFERRADATFGNWLARIADNRLCDAIKQHDCAKHGGDLRRLEDAAGNDSSILSLWDWIASADTSPGSIVAREEAVQAMQVALAALPSDQRAAIRMRFLEGKSLEETAAALDRTPDAVRGLVHRGKEQLLAAMGRASKWLKSK